jgi:hypothetical protein
MSEELSRGSVDLLKRLNRGSGGVFQTFIQRSLLILVFGPALRLFALCFFRCHVEGGEHVRALGRKGIYAVRHFYEWDFFLTFALGAWPRALFRPHLAGRPVGGQFFWSKTAGGRALAWFTNMIFFIRGHEPEDGGGLQTARRTLLSPSPSTLVLSPTGPVGRRRDYQVRYGVAWLARECPDVPVLPITLLGVQELRLRDVLLLRRPRIALVVGAPIFGRDHDRSDAGVFDGEFCERIRACWTELEGIAPAVPVSPRPQLFPPFDFK